MSAAIRILLGLAAGLAVGAAVSAFDQPWLRFVVPFLEPVGQLFVNAIRMTVIPLIISKLIVGIASASDAAVVRSLGITAVLFFGITLVTAATFGVFVGSALL